MRLLASVVSVISALSLGTSAFAATVTVTQGQVLVNRGQGYQAVVGSTEIGAGATVVANPGAVAQVVYSSLCAVTVKPGTVYTIAAQPPCPTGGSTALQATMPPAGTPADPGISDTTLIVGGVVVVGGVALGVLLSQKGKSASP
jgi:hypothetical protein